jgi:DNA-binding CsgD family transcriptional regulator/DNA-binding MarR family transcriptional regulator
MSGEHPTCLPGRALAVPILGGVEPFIRLDPAQTAVAAFVSDDLALSIWEMLRRFGRRTSVSDLAAACSLKAPRVQRVMDQAAELGLVRRHAATRTDRRVRYEATADRIVLEMDPGSEAASRLLSSCFRRFAGESRRCIDESMADVPVSKDRRPMKVAMTHLALDDSDAAELIALFKPIDEFVARASEKYDRDPAGSPRRCNYHVALHVVPVSIERLPPARMAFASRGAGVAKVEGEVGGRAARLLSPRELAVAERLSAGATIASVAAELGVSPKTVATLCERTYRKLGIRRRAQLAARLYALGKG